MSEYAKRDVEALGEFYTRHVSAMTIEGLYAKSAIAAELAHRDAVNAALLTALETIPNPRGFGTLEAFITHYEAWFAAKYGPALARAIGQEE